MGILDDAHGTAAEGEFVERRHDAQNHLLVD